MFVHAGSIRQFREQAGKELTTSLLGAGGVLGEEALLPDEDLDTSLVRAVAVEPSIVELVPTEVCRELADRFPDLERALLRIAMRRAGDAERLAEAIAYRPLEERLAQLLLDLAARYGRATLDGGVLIDTSVTQQQLASMIGAGREALARLFTNWRGAGTIELRRRQVVILDQPALRALAGEPQPAADAV
jgi:CRP/FNR family transcriptional regulator